MKLSKSIEKEPKPEFDIDHFFGAWNDHRSSDEILSEIKNSRVEKLNTESFE